MRVDLPDVPDIVGHTVVCGSLEIQPRLGWVAIAGGGLMRYSPQKARELAALLVKAADMAEAKLEMEPL